MQNLRGVSQIVSLSDTDGCETNMEKNIGWIKIGIEKKNIRKFRGTQNEFRAIEIYEIRNLVDQIWGMKYTGQHLKHSS